MITNPWPWMLIYSLKPSYLSLCISSHSFWFKQDQKEITAHIKQTALPDNHVPPHLLFLHDRFLFTRCSLFPVSILPVLSSLYQFVSWPLIHQSLTRHNNQIMCVFQWQEIVPAVFHQLYWGGRGIWILDSNLSLLFCCQFVFIPPLHALLN